MAQGGGGGWEPPADRLRLPFRRKPAASFQDTVDAINGAGGRAVGIAADAADAASLDAAFARVARDLLPGLGLAAAVYNVGAAFKRAPFLETTVEDYDAAAAGNA